MDSDDDLRDNANDDHQSLEDFYSEDDVVDAEHEYFGDDHEASGDSKQQNYVVLSEADIRQRQEDAITAVSSVLSLSRAESTTLLSHYKWSVSKVNEEWFADEETVRKAVGLLKNPKPLVGEGELLTCGICFDNFKQGEIFDADCGHPFCGVCWGGYISSSINDGPGCLTLRCPDPSCNAAVGRNMIDALAVSEDDRKKYDRYLVRSYVEDSRKTKWCPAPGCDYTVDFSVGSDGNFDVICGCSYGFCWNCVEEAHRPVDCGTVNEWISKNSSESENTNWILANSKPCPKCKRPIEKNQGCMIMTCRPPCSFQFCWLCLLPVFNHIHFRCNGYKKAREQDEAEKRREMAKNSLERYTHYYERWAANDRSRKKAAADLEQMRSVHLEKLSETKDKSEVQLKFLIDAWSQIVECRRVLKWTYAYGYYLPENESAKRQLFECLQGEAELGLERLHHCAEKEFQDHLTAQQGPSDDDHFVRFRTKLVGLTSVTQTYFDNLVKALENGLLEAVQKQKKRKGPDIIASTSSGPSWAPADDPFIIDGDHDLNYWPCDRCTYLNANSAIACQMCNEQG